MVSTLQPPRLRSRWSAAIDVARSVGIFLGAITAAAAVATLLAGAGVKLASWEFITTEAHAAYEAQQVNEEHARTDAAIAILDQREADHFREVCGRLDEVKQASAETRAELREIHKFLIEWRRGP